MNAPLTILATAIAVLPTLAVADTTCQPRILESRTTFPMRSQLRGQEGIVYIDVQIDSNGRATRTELQHSSGYRLLDRAALESVRNHWTFDISNCVRKDLPATHRIGVDFRNGEY
ncbi:energy transducer TonB [Povalibacter sp.]|uniref:energy transducer TonB n=1 Tax=Povalibacter sp. TaxID=1962978 RepID=UPI002F4201E6